MGGKPGACVPETMRFNGNGYYNGGSNSQNASCALASSPSYNAVSSQGLSYIFPNVAAGADDNTVAEGQKVAVTASVTLPPGGALTAGTPALRIFAIPDPEQ